MIDYCTHIRGGAVWDGMRAAGLIPALRFVGRESRLAYYFCHAAIWEHEGHLTPFVRVPKVAANESRTAIH